MPAPNDYSDDWFNLFLQTYPDEFTRAEVKFILQFLPLADYPHILDICCGTGRHAHYLAGDGYHITGIDINEDAITRAKAKNTENTSFLVHDMRRIDTLPGVYDGAINMWQSFGYFDDATNTAILKAIHNKLHTGGRFIIDIYNRDFFEKNTGEKQFERAGKIIVERKYIKGNRLTVELDYGDVQNADVFSWQIFTPGEFSSLADDCGFDVIASCTHATVDMPVSEQFPRMQIVLQKR